MRTRRSMLFGFTAMATMLFAPCQFASAQQTQSNPFPNGCNPFHHGNNPFHHGTTFPKNGPFVVPALCTGDSSTVTVIRVNRKPGLLIRGDQHTNYAGWEVFTSHPGTKPGTITPSATTTAPAGTYSFTLSGLGSTPHVSGEIDSVDSLAHFTRVTLSNVTDGPISVTAPAVPGGTSLVAVTFWFGVHGEPLPVGTYTVTDFKVNGKAIGIDTTHTDNAALSNLFTWCDNF